jgi:hypothetical protein
MRRTLKGRLVSYEIPQDFEVVPEIKCYSMGKVNEKELIPTVFGDAESNRRRSISTKQNKRTET